ncbi:DUF262 domain-containing protein [Simplicispira psychrophila]|uniref:DUF262 domain-containing protein n=1 Tax=Simplicispira psychrophila TaxID=80882 RepID=UPI00068DCB16|nr:DUF262 domain-containing protein [Simplicispira psychrophila]
MDYKLEHRTIGFGIDSVSRRPTTGIEGVFFIPAYQRGYRWTEDEIKKLLDDIWETEGKPYSLQPVVVKKREDGAWELIDGQQRLTTLWLILRFMQKGDARYTLEYATRTGSQSYLASLDPAQADSNIDYFHLHRAHTTIADWFENKLGAQYKQFLIDEIFRFLCTSVRVIWYEVPASEKPIPLFTRLNQGRIPLTDAELLKAVLLSSVAKSKPGRETEIAAQWDGMERDLQRTEIWAFVAGNVQDDDRYGTRISLLLDTLAQQKNPVSGTAPRYHTFDTLRERAESDSLLFWREVETLHAQILGWFEDSRAYNKIGFLVTCGMSIGHIQRCALERNKSAFDVWLIEQIKNMLKVSADNLDEGLRYEGAKGDSSALQQILLLFNVQVCRERFPFEKHVGQDWTLEHIHAQNAQSLNRAEEWNTWLIEHRKALVAIQTVNNASDIPSLINEIDDALPDIHNSRFGERFHALAARIQKILTLDDEGADHTIANLALLSRGDNAALSNSVFEVKRQKILAMDKDGYYIPAATRNVFLKYYTQADGLHPHFWGSADKAEYLQEIKTQLAPYLQ